MTIVKLRAQVFCFVLSCFASSISAATLTKPFVLSYDVGNNVITAGKATLALKQAQENWQYELVIRPRGLFKLAGVGKIVETATFSALKSPYETKQYSYYQKREEGKSYIANFDRDNSVVNISRDDRQIALPFDGVITDRLSITLELVDKIQTDPKLTYVSFQVLDNGRIRTLDFTSRGVQTINTKLGKIPALLLHRGDNIRETFTWFGTPPGAEKSVIVPVLIEQHKKGKLQFRLSASKFKAM